MSMKRFTAFVAGGAAVAAATAMLIVAPANAADTWAVISYSPATGAYGWANQSSTEQDATNRATGFCIQYGGTDCQKAAWVRNGCAALATKPDGAWHGGIGPTTAAAEENALWQNNGGTIQVSKCSAG